ncbi:MAG: protoheme IX farnesyltransferase [Planctomycetaceae bacterium]|nr:heme o synthase [Planctomycetales bacterium]MCB9874743.1 protoheme IX farnesyltransferase [Planctomycetaceae bacterium]HRX80150.1 heme o synthase [Pirellulaceae bacterium]
MSTTTLSLETTRSHRLARVADYVELTKPRIGVLVLVTVAISYCCARWGQPEPWAMFHAMLGTLLVASSASALNQYLERKLDLRMDRTAERPLPAGRLTKSEVITFAVITILVGEAYLALLVNLEAALWGLLTWAIYVWLYTPLKTRTPLNTAIGAISGALPVFIGWSAAGGVWSDHLRASSLFMIVFLWQFPHFMAIAWMYRKQYGQAGMQMLSVVDPTGRRAGVQAVCGALALLPVSLLPGLFTPGFGGSVYIVVAFLLGLMQLAFAVAFCTSLSELAAKRLLKVSLVYLPTMLMLALVVLWF